MTNPPIHLDPELEFVLRQHYPLLEGARVQIVGSFIDESTSLGVVEASESLIVLQAHQPSIDASHDRSHIFFTREEGASLINYQLVHPTVPWPQPTLSVGMVGPTTGVSLGKTSDRIQVQLKRAGTIQLWWGGGIGEIWEATLEGHGLPKDTTALLHGVWERLEQALKERGCERVYTLARDPAYGDAYYQAFLTERGYRPSDAHMPRTQLAWVKRLTEAPA